MKKLLFISPHLSTGGQPQYLYKQIQSLVNDYEIYCIEWENVTGGVLVVQRNLIKKLLGNRLITLDEDKNKILTQIAGINPDIIHFQEIPEYFIPYDIAVRIYKSDRQYKIIETSHDSGFDINGKLHFPDRFLMVSDYQVNKFKQLGIPTELVEYPIETKTKTRSREEILTGLGLDPNLKHVVNVGLFTPRKNQAEIIEYAKELQDYPIQFHFIGNQADNFKYYWEPIMQDFPSNCKWWGERSDVDTFYQMADLFLFTSRGHQTDKETMPLVIREAIGWNIPSLIYNLDVYLGYFDKYKNIKYLDFSSKEKNKTMILQSLKIKNKNMFNVRYDSSDNKIWFNSSQSFKNLIVSIKDAESNSVLWSVNYEHFPSNIDYWVIPTPKSFIDFEKSPLISSLSIEFFEMNKLIYKKDIKIKESTIKKYKLKLENHTEPTFMNYCEFFIDGIYDKYLKGKSYQTVVDVGANIGLWVEYIQNVADIKTIYAVEPNLKALDCLKTSYGDSIQIVNKAMANIDGQLDFFVDTENSTISSLAQYGSLTTSYKVDSITFKTFLKQYGLDKVDLLKIDIETGEYPLLESFDNSDFEKIDNLLIEYHLLSGRTYEKDVNYILNKLKMTGYYVYVKNMHDIGGFIFASKQELPESVDNIEIKKLLDNNGCPDKGDLASLVNKMFPNGIGVEIGVLRGDYSKIILERWPAGTLYLIDTWRHLGNYIDMNGQDDVYHYECLIKTCENIKHWQDRAHIIRMDSALSANLFPDEYFDFIYIDADHSYGGVVRDIEAWWPKIKKGGLFCGDDYISDDGDIWLTGQGEPIYAGKFGVRRAVNEFIKKKDLPLYETKNEPYWKQWYTFKPF